MIKRRSIISLLIYSVLLAIFVINGKASHTRKVSYDVLVPARDCGVYHRLSWCSWWFLCHYHWVTECYTVYHHETRYYTECLDGWTGKYCDIRYKCVAPETCKCLTTGGSCTSVPCSPQQSCFPGTCVGGKCQCPQTHGGEDCQQIQIMPTIEVCEVTIQDEKTILSQATCAYQDQELPNVRVNSKNWKQISLNIEAKAKDFNFPTSRGLDHISFPLKFGVASGGFNLYKNDRKLNMKTCEITAEVAKVYYKCHVSENANALELNHGDIITIEAFSSLGGTKEGTKIPGIDNSFFRKVIFTGVKAMRNISFQVDVEPPTHCYKKDCNYTPIQLDKDITSDPAIQPKFYGWDDEDSGIKYYHVQVFLMHLSYENVFVNLGEPFLDRQLKPKDPDFDNFVVNCKKPGVHSIELTVYDGSNNTAKARNIFIYTGPTKPKINLDNPIMISDAKQNNKTGEYWITDELFHKKNRILKISWDGHFMSEAKFTDEWAHPVDPWRGKGYEDLPEPDLFMGIRTINRLNELKYGIMTYSIAHYIDQVEGAIAYNYTNVKLLNSTTLEEEIDARTSRLGATIGIKLSAYDVAGEKKEKEIKIRIDTTAPELKNWTLIQNDPDIYTSKVLLVIKDKESGLDKINFKLLQVLDGSNKFPIKSGEAEIITKYPPKILPYRKKRKSLKGSCQISDEDCYCTPYRSCFTNNQFITIDHCWIDRQVKTKNTIEIQFEVFNQAGISSGVRIMELTDLDDLHCRPGYCDEETIITEKHGNVSFDGGVDNDVKNSSSVCFHEESLLLSKARAICLLNESTERFSWRIDHFYDCIRMNISQINEELLEILDEINTNYEESINKMVESTNKLSISMTVNDVVIVGEFLEKASESVEISEEVGKNLLNIVNCTMATIEGTAEDLKNKNLVTSQLQMINTMEAVASKIDINTNNLSLNFDKFVVQIHETTEIKNETFNLILDKTSESIEDDPHISVTIPEEAFLKARQKTNLTKLRTCLIVYRSTTFFDNLNITENKSETTNNNLKLKSYVISSSIKDAEISDLSTKIVLTFKLENGSENPKCVYSELKDDDLKWYEDGLALKSYNKTTGIVECETNHLTNFAVLAGYHRDIIVGHHARALSLISIVGIVLSIVCLSLVVFSQMFFRKYRKGQYQIALLNLSIALIITNLLIILGLDPANNKIACKSVALLLHYFLLVAFTWMLIEAILQYFKFVKVFDTHVRKFALKTMIPAWTLPALIVIITASIDINQYGRNDYCWLAENAFHFAFLLPLGLIIVTNVVIFIRIIKGISCDRPKGMKTNQTKSRLVWLQVQAGMCCFVVMGLTWSFALVSFSRVALIMQYLFAILNSFQGFFVFVLFCLREKPVRMAWYGLLCRSKASKKLVTSSETSSTFSRFNKVKKNYGEVSPSEFSGSTSNDLAETSMTRM